MPRKMRVEVAGGIYLVVSRGWTIRTFPGGHVAQQEDPRGVATLMENAVSDRNKPASSKPVAVPEK